MPNQAVSATPPIFSETSFANTWAKDQRKAPERIKTTPNNFPSRLGFPERITIPKKAITNPIIFLTGTYTRKRPWLFYCYNSICLLNRFKNSFIEDKLLRIAMDGSLKLPIRIIETLKINKQNTGKKYLK